MCKAQIILLNKGKEFRSKFYVLHTSLHEYAKANSVKSVFPKHPNLQEFRRRRSNREEAIEKKHSFLKVWIMRRRIKLI